MSARSEPRECPRGMKQAYTCLARECSDTPKLAPKTGARTWGTDVIFQNRFVR
jgi:hypothetical protein